MSKTKRLRCAVYTRKSTEEGLDQDFNSLDAQREACSAFIASQAGLGWKELPDLYDDGGVSGGTLDRPALELLLTEIRAGRIDVVVVYKIDRMTRSLMDFARLVDVFDRHDVSFVSVTQQFNTTTSMGRLTLNVLLSFAQFEREVTAERIRDKIAASKKKGMWMGGSVPLGYEVRKKQLVVNEGEAETVRQLFRLYVETGSVPRLKEKADALGIVTRIRTNKDGSIRGGKPFARGNLYRLLSNPIYRGLIEHDGQTYEGNHDAIVPKDLWNAVQEQMASNAAGRSSPKNGTSIHILTGLVFDETGDRLSPTHAIKKNHRYRYYISARIMRERRKQKDGWRVPAAQIEGPVLAALCAYLNDQNRLAGAVQDTNLSATTTSHLINAATALASRLGQSDPFKQKRVLGSIVSRIQLHKDYITIDIDTSALVAQLSEGLEAADLNRELPPKTDRIELKHHIKRRGVETKLVLTDGASGVRNPDPTLVRTIAISHLWRRDLTTGRATSIQELAKRHGEDAAEVSRFLPFAWLAPDIVQNIFDGKQPVDLTLERFRRMPALPILWKDQRQLLGFET